MKRHMLLAVIFILMTACKNDDNGSPTCTDVACTEIYVSLSISVVDTDSRPVILDRYSVVRVDNNQDITPNISDYDLTNMKQNGVYPVFSDTYARDFQNRATDILFTGYLGDKAVATSTFTVGADCCHVHFISDNTTIVVDISS